MVSGGAPGGTFPKSFEINFMYLSGKEPTESLVRGRPLLKLKKKM